MFQGLLLFALLASDTLVHHRVRFKRSARALGDVRATAAQLVAPVESNVET